MAPSARPRPSSVIVRELSAAERSPRWGPRLRRREAVARSLTLVPAAYLLGAIVLGVALPQIDRAAPGVFGLGFGGDSAQSVLETIASAMIAFAGVVVSVAVLVVQFGASQYSPRLVPTFLRDSLVKHALGLFIAPGVYALVAALGTGGATKPDLTILFGVGLMAATLLSLFRFVQRLLDNMRPRHIFLRLGTAARRALTEVYPFGLDEEVEVLDAPGEGTGTRLQHEGADAVLAAIDRGRLVRAAQAAGVCVELVTAVGTHVARGTDLFVIHGDGDVDRGELRESMILASERTVTQDPAFAIRATVDVAIRALSPAVNDPTTAVNAIDALEPTLLQLAGRRLEADGLLGDDGELRVVMPTTDWHEYLDLALTEIRHYGAGSPQVARRLLALLGALREHTPAARHEPIDAHLALLEAAVARVYASPTEQALVEIPDRQGLGSNYA